MYSRGAGLRKLTVNDAELAAAAAAASVSLAMQRPQPQSTFSFAPVDRTLPTICHPSTNLLSLALADRRLVSIDLDMQYSIDGSAFAGAGFRTAIYRDTVTVLVLSLSFERRLGHHGCSYCSKTAAYIGAREFLGLRSTPCGSRELDR